MRKALLVEDDPMISEIYQRKLGSSDFSVDPALSASEALAKAKENAYDVVLLDLVLPEMNGLEILAKLRSDSSYNPDLKVIIFSNLNDQESQEEAMRLGAIGYIEKSLYSPSEMVSEVERLLHQAEEREKNAKKREVSSFGNGARKEDAKRILLIEDEAVFVEIFGDKLRDEGYNVEAVSRGDDGLRMALEKEYDLVITDFAVPGIKGDAVVRGIRENERTKNLPVLVFSASIIDEEVDQIKTLDIQGFFPKTQTTPSILAQHVHKIFESMDTK